MTAKQIMEVENKIHDLKMEAFRTVIKDGSTADDANILIRLNDIEKELFDLREWLVFKEKYNV